MPCLSFRQSFGGMELRRFAVTTGSGDDALRSVAIKSDSRNFAGDQQDQLRAHLAAVIESSDDAIISKTLEGIICTWNTGAERMFGYSAHEVVGKHITILIPPDRLNEEVDIIARLRRGERIEHFETVRCCKDRTHLDISLSISPIKDANGSIVGAAKIARDITARKRTEQALWESEARLRAVVEATPECVKIVAPDGSLVFMNAVGIRLIEADSLSTVQGACVYNLIASEHRAEWSERHRRICTGENLSWQFEIVGLAGTAPLDGDARSSFSFS